MRLIDHASFIDLVSAASVKSRTYARLQEFEAVDQLKEILEIGDQVLALARIGELLGAEQLLHELRDCYEEPLERTAQLEEVKCIVRKCGK